MEIVYNIDAGLFYFQVEFGFWILIPLITENASTLNFTRPHLFTFLNVHSSNIASQTTSTEFDRTYKSQQFSFTFCNCSDLAFHLCGRQKTFNKL